MAKRKQRQRSAGQGVAQSKRTADFDSPWKDALDRYFEPFLALLFPQAHADLDWRRG